MTAKHRAAVATLLFAAAGLCSMLFQGGTSVYRLPHVIFYAVLTLNTYYSIRFYSAFTPNSLFQGGIDFLLVVAYIALALSIGQPLAFSLCALLVFMLAPAKYAHMLGRTPHDGTLRRKIRIDLLGTLLCSGAVALTLYGLPLPAAWLLAGLFTIANVYLLWVRPMYAHEAIPD